jgi:deazaflavin-dependent oxidoreductase (nitroreductase family)
LDGEYEPSPTGWVREQVETYEASGGTEANTLRETGIPIVVFTCRGRSSGKLRKFALMRVEHDGQYALVASKGGADAHPAWYLNLVDDPTLQVQDGPEPFVTAVRELDGAEYDTWWERAVQVFPTYAEYREATDRRIPVLLTT